VCVCVEILRETEKERENLKKTNKNQASELLRAWD
jgi:hypothetical protein